MPSLKNVTTVKHDMETQNAAGAHRNVLTDMRLISVGTQAGIFDTRLVTGFLLDIFEKLHEVHQTYTACSEDLEKGRENINRTEQTMSTMGTSLGAFSDNVDRLGVHLLHDNASLANKHLALERIRKDVAVKRSHVEELAKNLACPRDLRWREQRLQDMKQERAKLELQLAKVNSVIDSTYEEMYSVQERLYGIKDIRENRRADQVALIGSMTERCIQGPAKKSQLLSLTGPDAVIDLRDIYVSPAEFTQLQADIEIIKHKQLQFDRHIQMQNEEKEFLRETANKICEKVYDLERKVRKETGDHGFESGRTEEPQWYQDLGNPTVWFTSPKLTLDQLKLIIERQTMEFRYAPARGETELPSTSGEMDEEDIVSTELML